MIVNFAHNPGSHWLLHSCECSGQNPAIIWGELDAICQYHGPSVVTAQGVLLNTSLWCKAFCSRWHSYFVPMNRFLVPFIWEILQKEWHLAVTSRAGKSRGWSWSFLLLEPWSVGKIWLFEPPGWQVWHPKAPHIPSALHSRLLFCINTGHGTVLCCAGWTSTKSPLLSDLILCLMESGATFKLGLWNNMNKPQKVVWVQKGISLALYIYWHLSNSSLSYSEVLEDKFTLPNGKKPKQNRNKLNSTLKSHLHGEIQNPVQVRKWNLAHCAVNGKASRVVVGNELSLPRPVWDYFCSYQNSQE